MSYQLKLLITDERDSDRRIIKVVLPMDLFSKVHTRIKDHLKKVKRGFFCERIFHYPLFDETDNLQEVEIVKDRYDDLLESMSVADTLKMFSIEMDFFDVTTPFNMAAYNYLTSLPEDYCVYFYFE